MVVTPDEVVLMDKLREDSSKLQAVMQFLESRGLMKTLTQLQLEADTEFNPHALNEGALLDVALDRYMVASSPSGSTIATTDPFPLPGECATDIAKEVPNVHGSGNPTCVAWHPRLPDVVVTGGADRRVIVNRVGLGDNEGSEAPLPSPVLSVDWSADGTHLSVGCMGGEVVMFAVAEDLTLNELCVSKPHGTAKVASVLFSPDGSLIATAANDIAVQIFKRTEAGFENVPTSTIRCIRDVSAIAWIDPTTLIVAETDQPLLSVYTVSTDARSICIGQICMNLSIDDPRTAYTTLALSFNAEQRILAACTNRNSALLFKPPNEWEMARVVCPVKALYGMSLGIYDIPSIATSVDGSFVYVSSDKEIVVFEARTGHRVFNIGISDSKPVRCMRRHPETDSLATVSFDKQLKIIV